MQAKEVIVFGAGKVGREVIYVLKIRKVHIVACFDNDLEKAGQKLWGDVSCDVPGLINKNIPILIAVQSIPIRQKIKKQCIDIGYLYIYEVDVQKLDLYINSLSDEEFLKLQFFERMSGKILNLEEPKSFNEKMQWLKVYDHNPVYTTMVDKYEVKKYVAGIIGERYIIPTLGVWNNYEEIDFSQLPNQFVLKCTHDSGSTFLVKDKCNIDNRALAQKFKEALGFNYYHYGREWAYKNVPPRIIAEKLMVNLNKEALEDYKIMCFNGKVLCTFTCTDRFSRDGMKVTFYDTAWKKMPFERHYPSEKKECAKPQSYDEMVGLAERLSANIPFARIDFYEVNGHPYFGEITLYPGCGYEEFTPGEWDEIMGSWLKLPEKT